MGSKIKPASVLPRPPTSRPPASNLLVTLIHPGAPIDSSFERLGRSDLPPLGILYVASSLQQAGHRVRVHDVNLEGLGPDLVQRVCAARPQVVGLGTLAPAFDRVAALARQLRQRLPAETLLLAGGPDASTRTARYVELGCFDAVLVGEAEQTMVALCEAYPEVPQIAGVLPAGAPVEDVVSPTQICPDEVPFPARHLLPLRSYRGGPAFKRGRHSTSIFTHRGCPYQCTFCEKGVHEGPVRLRSAGSVLEEVRRIRRDHDIHDIRFIDDVFMINHSILDEFLELVLSSGERFNWLSTARVDLISEELLRKLKRAGCYRLEMGIESGSERILTMVNKGVNMDQMARALEATRSAGMETIANFIMGFPTETEDEIRQTTRFALRLQPDYAAFFTFYPFEGSKIAQTFDLDATDGARDPDVFPVSYERVLQLVDEAYTQFYFRPGYALSRLAAVRNGWIAWDLARMAGLHALKVGLQRLR